MLLLAFALGLRGCAGFIVQNPESPLKPINAAEAPGAGRLMLQGYDLVTYFVDGRATPRSAAHQSSCEGVDFSFASAEHKAMFDRNLVRSQPDPVSGVRE